MTNAARVVDVAACNLADLLPLAVDLSLLLPPVFLLLLVLLLTSLLVLSAAPKTQKRIKTELKQ